MWVEGGRQLHATPVVCSIGGHNLNINICLFVLQLRQRMETPAPSEEDITLLMGLGFDRETVVRVLRSSGNNTEAAANRLLGH